MITPAVIIPHNDLVKPATISTEPIINLPYRMDIYWVLKDTISLLKPVLEMELKLEDISNNIDIQIVNFNSSIRSFLRYPLLGDDRYIIYVNNFSIIKYHDLHDIIEACIENLCWQYGLIYYHLTNLYPDRRIPGCEYNDVTNPEHVASQITYNLCLLKLPVLYYNNLIYDKYNSTHVNHGTIFDFVRWMNVLYDATSLALYFILDSLNCTVSHYNIKFIHHYYPPECVDTYYDIQYRDGIYYVEYNCNIPDMYRKEDVLEYTTELILYSILDVIRLSENDAKCTRILDDNPIILDSVYMSIYSELAKVYNVIYRL